MLNADKRLRLKLLAALVSLGSGCFLRSASIPMPAVLHPTPSAKGLIVFLPGFGDGPEDYVKHGFVRLVQQANPRFDVIAADAHFGYYRGFTVVERLHEDVIQPARARGYRRIWLVGISMGGLGAAAYAMEHSDIVDGVILLAPYMGDSDIIQEVKAAGGLAAWSPPKAWQQIEDSETRKYYQLWSWYRAYHSAPADQPKLYLGYGDQDRLRGPGSMVTAVLPKDQQAILPGGHKWKVWRPLFERFVAHALTADLDQGPVR